MLQLLACREDKQNGHSGAWRWQLDSATVTPCHTVAGLLTVREAITGCWEGQWRVGGAESAPAMTAGSSSSSNMKPVGAARVSYRLR